MEVDPTVEHEDMGGADGMDSLFSELAGAIPRIDEAMSFAEMLKAIAMEGTENRVSLLTIHSNQDTAF
ncbi:hypothetical protein JHK82_016441 [Glycine max]|nr:hypothetical protein JHK82_016441 [Glycine max]